MFGIADYPAFCAAILVFLALPGPGTFALLASTAKAGMRGGAAATAGIICGDQVLLWLAIAGVAALLTANPAWFRAIQCAGAAYLAWIGLRLIFARQLGSLPIPMTSGHYARQALLITLLNPKAIVFYMAFFPLFIDPQTHRGTVTFLAMAVTIAGITAAYCLGLCALVQRLGHKWDRNQRMARWLERVAGVLLIAFGIRLGGQ